jgi:N-acyl-D-amino-acid deacylase
MATSNHSANSVNSTRKSTIGSPQWKTNRSFACRLSWAIAAWLVLLGTTVVGAGEIPEREWRQLSSPAEAGWSVEKLHEARAQTDALDTAAVMIVEAGVVVDQWGTTALPLNCHSVRKSFLSALFGRYVEDGTIDLERTLEQLGIDDREPSLTDEEKTATVRQLLQARSGVYHPALYETRAMAAARPKRGSHPPGTFWYYNNWDFNAVCSIFENHTGRSVFEEFERRLAEPLGMQDFDRTRHTKYVTGKDSIHRAYPFELSTRDLARFGLLMLREGRWGDRQLISPEWVAESTRSYSEAGASGGYGYMWWVAADGKHYPGVELPAGSYSARGHRGQYLVVIPEYDLIVAHRVNSFQNNTSVARSDFGQVLALILAARPERSSESQTSSAPAQQKSSQQAPKRADRDQPSLDVILRGGEIIDGTGAARSKADIGIRGGRIVSIGNLADQTAEHVIDAAGKIVAPGFIDLHSHADRGLVHSDPLRRAAPNLITQGITTVVVNQDGSGPRSIAEQRKTMLSRGVGPNVIQMIGHGQVRRDVMKSDYRRPARPDEIAEMAALVRQGMDEGAFGISAGLEYVPGRWSTTRELESLVAELAPYRGVFVVHERSSGSRPMWYLPSRDSADQPSMIDNLREQIDIAAATGVNVVATHIKARGVDFWGSSRAMIDMLQQARDEGVPIFADQYAYNTSGSDGRIVLLPSWALDDKQAGDTPAERLKAALASEPTAAKVREDIAYEITRRGGPESILIVDHPDKDLIGKSLQDVVARLKCDPVDAVIGLQFHGNPKIEGGARLRAFSMSEKDVEEFAKVPWVATSSDAGIALPSDGRVHPRFYGAFPRKLRHYALDRGLMSLEEAVRVSSALPAEILRLRDRGTLQVGAVADIVVFDPQRIRDKADAFNPHQYCKGVEHVLVGGEQAVADGRMLGKLAGKVLIRTEEQTTD